MHIGQVAKSVDLTIDTIRFYEKCGLLEKPSRGPGGFRLYSSQDVAVLGFIRRVQELGFSLQEIRELLRLRATHIRACASVRDLLDQKLQRVREKRAELQRLEQELAAALRKCNRVKRERKERPARCPILDGGAAEHEGAA